MFDLFAKPLPAGTPAPPFELPDQDGCIIRLAAFRGRNLILVFYPGDNTPVCRRQLCELRDRDAWLREQNVQVLGINSQNAASHRDFRDRNAYPFPLLVDARQQVSRLYRAAGLMMTRRTVYLVNRDGIIAFSERGKPEPERILAALTS